MAKTAARLPRPRAIVIVSAHWSTAEPTIGADGPRQAFHDFHGFPAGLYNLDYPASGDRAVASEVHAALTAAGFSVHLESSRGLDHGAWIPLRLMYPQADIPVIPLSLQNLLGPQHHYALGLALAGLAGSGILIVASGNLTHNLRDYQRAAQANSEPPAYVQAFADWMGECLETHDIEALLDYRTLAPEATRAHPSEEHLLPFYVALGAAGNDWHAERLYSGIDDHVLSMDSFAFWPRH
jgi:4,5-DOPA dioxygenase extradiol